MEQTHKERGFTLVEVLVALAIIAVSMSAAVRVAGGMTQSNGLLRDRSIALLAAQNRLAELRLEGQLKAGVKTLDCDQGRLLLRCDQTLSAMAGSTMMLVNVRVSERGRQGPPLARLETILGRPWVKPQ
ncbi:MULTISPECIES: type II secretion system minor pseudopilin GspI [Pseudomonas syringae group]|uniref:Type II secretion system protein I n=1 Tax=Pseudomonas syringae pv. ribicola TaxID=55398 RepID=A0A0N8SPM9_PSESI|nr:MULTISPECIES: type II secretion system minor pseudopilin GspI [Pseudomonas syringae group]EKN46986.1 general secretory pathway protein I/V [Pseudomonas viridiflava UASWS0038]KPL66276.1 general secretion pathway protein GspI [Pseudomonas viridiflava]KPY46840.1 proteinral secretory pathway protein I/V [Pseudomonas syringae pv. ribicola]KPZ18784.1 proteinral secretory pathway protein I/V [Pseudomonas viridiflava]OAG92458.1 type II secretion system protein GspI [Pseudomonas viridiflava]